MEIEDLFEEVAYHYGEEQAITDGALVHPYPELWPWALVTRSVYDECEADAAETGRDLDQVLKPLMIDAIATTQRAVALNPHCDLVELEHTAAGTVWIRPNWQGGITIMQPEDH
jgi:hypothetical protein